MSTIKLKSAYLMFSSASAFFVFIFCSRWLTCVKCISSRRFRSLLKQHSRSLPLASSRRFPWCSTRFRALAIFPPCSFSLWNRWIQNNFGPIGSSLYFRIKFPDQFMPPQKSFSYPVFWGPHLLLFFYQSESVGIFVSLVFYMNNFSLVAQCLYS